MRSFLAILVGVLMLTEGVSAAQPSDQALVRVATALAHSGPNWLLDGFMWMAEREGTHMLASVVAGTAGSNKSPSWYRPSETRFTWDWLARRMDGDGDSSITQDKFPGPAAWFATLDRDRDGKITPADFDWSSDSKLSKASQQAKMLFSAIDSDKNGQVTVEEWQKYMTKLAKDKTYLSQDDLLPLFLPPAPRKSFVRTPAVYQLLINAYFVGDVGSWFEGPNLNSRAPGFSLRSPDGKENIALSDSYGDKPVVLIFGSFT